MSRKVFKPLSALTSTPARRPPSPLCHASLRSQTFKGFAGKRPQPKANNRATTLRPVLQINACADLYDLVVGQMEMGRRRQCVARHQGEKIGTPEQNAPQA
jgi:hypothetical protein